MLIFTDGEGEVTGGFPDGYGLISCDPAQKKGALRISQCPPLDKISPEGGLT